jgi:hypothetical protein
MSGAKDVWEVGDFPITYEDFDADERPLTCPIRDGGKLFVLRRFSDGKRQVFCDKCDISGCTWNKP